MGAASIMGVLSARGCRWDAPRGGGGFGALDKSCVAAALSGLPPHVMNLGMLLFVGGQQARRQLLQNVSEVIRNSYGKGLDAGLLARLSDSAIDEFLQRQRCPDCRGRGTVSKSQVDSESDTPGAVQAVKRETVVAVAPCDACLGSGVKSWSVRRRAGRAGLNDRTYGRRYATARDAGYRAICTWLEDLDSHLTVQLVDD